MILSLIFTATNLLAIRVINVSGHVVNDRTGSGTGIGAVKIKVYSWHTLSKEYVKTEYSNTNGYYSFQLSLGLGPYEFEFSKAGYFLSEEYMLFDLPEPVRLIPMIDYQADVDFTNINPTNSIPKGYSVPVTYTVKNKDNYYTLTSLELNIKIESTGWLFQEGDMGYLDFDGWLKIDLDFSLNPGQTKSKTNHIPTMFRLYDSADTSPNSLGIFALNYGAYEVTDYALTGASTHDGKYTGVFYSDYTSQTDEIDIIKVAYEKFDFVFALYDSYWRYGNGDDWDGSGYAPSWFFFTGEDSNVNDKFNNQFNLKFGVYDQIFYQTTGRPTTDGGWWTLTTETIAPEFLGLGEEWNIRPNPGDEWLQKENHGFDSLVVFIGEKGEHYGWADVGGNRVITFIDSGKWWAPQVDIDQIDNLIQHEISHNFGAPNHEGWFDPTSVMTLCNVFLHIFLDYDNWLDTSAPYDDVSVMENAIDSYWEYRNN
jgi:5-hydroxyisourate hydrolase-like protein (transthyretin family)